MALEILNGYFNDDEPPIIIAAQTNHALDQLLTHVSKFEPNYIRLGGRSTNVEIKKRALFEIRTKERLPPIVGGILSRATSNWKMQSKKMLQTLEPLDRDTIAPLSLATLVKHGVVTEKQSESLSGAASRWVSSDGTKIEPLLLWLDRSLIAFEVDYRLDYFGLSEEDEDLEVEQLREHEAESGVNDAEDAELLKGEFGKVVDNWTTADPVETDLEKAAEFLSTKQDLYKVPEYLRGPMYRVIQQRLKAIVLEKFRQQAVVYDQNLKDLKVGKWERDAVFLKRAKIVGLTTTGLSKYRPLIASLNPKVVLIEEAAEVLEAPVTVACMNSLEHLILVGDHQQLQGHCSVQDLENDPYYLNVSMFERLVRNNMPYKTLLQQRRMDSSFRKLIQPLYPALEDHASIATRESVKWGMGKVKSFFFSHEWSEYKDSQMSTYNPEEAKFIAGFYRYLVQNGVPSSAITILTFYNGQRKRLLKEIRAFSDLKNLYNLVKTVDSYQGEENEIVLLSLTRNNTEGKIGFLDISNRVCVALSRAKYGFYIFGNSELLSQKSLLWTNVVDTMAAAKRLANQQFPIYCESHKQCTILEYPDEWDKYDGGCENPCEGELPCGHMCQLMRHPFGHEKVFCAQPCMRTLACGHECQGRCSEMCSCNCVEFAQARRHQDVRIEPQVTMSNPGMDAAYISGQIPPSTPPYDASYLPEQVPELIELDDMEEMEEMQPGMQAGSHSNTRTGNQATFRSASSRALEARQTVNANRLSPEKQASSRGGWNHFASGGVNEDDERRQWSDNIPGPRMRASDWPTLDKAIKETQQNIGAGRNKFTHQYQPAGYSAAAKYKTEQYSR